MVSCIVLSVCSLSLGISPLDDMPVVPFPLPGITRCLAQAGKHRRGTRGRLNHRSVTSRGRSHTVIRESGTSIQPESTS